MVNCSLVGIDPRKPMADTTTWPEVMKTLMTVATTLSAVGLGASLRYVHRIGE